MDKIKRIIRRLLGIKEYTFEWESDALPPKYRQKTVYYARCEADALCDFMYSHHVFNPEIICIWER